MISKIAASTLSAALCLGFALAGTALGQTATHNLAINGGTGFTGTLGGNIAANVKLQSNDGSQFTFGILNVTDLDVVTISDGGFGNLFPDSVSLDNQGAALIAIAPTAFGINIPTTPFSSPVSGAISVTAGDQVADAVPGAIDPGVPGSDGAWDDPAQTGILNNAQVDNFQVAVNNPINAPAFVAGGTIAAVFPGNVTIPNIVNTSAFDVDLVIKDTSVLVVDFNDVQNVSIQNLSLSTTQVSPVTFPTSNFVESAHPTGYPQLDLSAIEGNLVATTVTGTLVADLAGTIFGSIDLRADVDVFGLVEIPVPFENAIHGELTSGTLISINESLNLPGTELPFGFTILHEPTADVDFDDVFAALRSGTFGLTVPFSFTELDMILNVPPASFEVFNQLYRVDEGFFAQGYLWIPHFSAELGGQLVLDLAANFEITADLLASAYEANAINVNAVPEPSTLALAALAATALLLHLHRRRRHRQ